MGDRRIWRAETSSPKRKKVKWVACGFGEAEGSEPHPSGGPPSRVRPGSPVGLGWWAGSHAAQGICPHSWADLPQASLPLHKSAVCFPRPGFGRGFCRESGSDRSPLKAA